MAEENKLYVAQAQAQKMEIHQKICKELHDTYVRKNHDYGDSFSKLFKKYKMPYALGHMEEKLQRIDSLSKKKAAVVGESIQDSLLDLANYAILTLIELISRYPQGEEECNEEKSER